MQKLFLSIFFKKNKSYYIKSKISKNLILCKFLYKLSKFLNLLNVNYKFTYQSILYNFYIQAYDMEYLYLEVTLLLNLNNVSIIKLFSKNLIKSCFISKYVLRSKTNITRGKILKAMKFVINIIKF